MNSNALGSYSFGDFDDNEFELARLMRQADVAWEVERPYLVKHGLASAHNVVDFACGPGIVTNLIKRDVVRNGSVVGVELNQQLKKIAEELHPSQDAPAFLVGDVYEPRCLEDDSYDFAYARFLLQHLSDPKKALMSVHKKLAPGGRFAVLDVDDGLFRFSPQISGLSDFLANADRAQAALGGNRRIGREIPALFWECGYSDIQVDTVPISTSFIRGNDFVDITTRFKLTLLSGSEQAQGRKVIDEMMKAIDGGDFFGVSYVFMVSGRK